MSSTDRKFTETGLPWHIVEEAINREIEWLGRVSVANSAEEFFYHPAHILGNGRRGGQPGRFYPD
jgi:hypothetical protein